MYKIGFIKLSDSEDLPTPKRMSEAASGFDIFAAVPESTVIQPGERALIPTGFALEMPEGIEAQIRPRSGLAMKHGITLLNTPGTIDSDYRGEIKIIMINFGDQPFTINRGDRVAQMVFLELPKVVLLEKEEISTTQRGQGGFGHTGI